MRTAFTCFGAIMLFFSVGVVALADDKAEAKGIRGELTKVDGKNVTFVKIFKEEKPTVTLATDDATKVVVNGKEGTLGDLKSGMYLLLRVNKKSKVIMSITASDSRPGKGGKKKGGKEKSLSGCRWA